MISQFRWLGVIVLASLAVAIPIGIGGGSNTAHATPGGLDRYGGHHCWTRCGSYGVYTGKYHCHKKTSRCKANKKVHRAHGH